MDKSIEVLKQIDPEWANLFVLRALRHYSDQLINSPLNSTPGMPTEQLRKLAEGYISWDDEQTSATIEGPNGFGAPQPEVQEEELADEEFPSDEDWNTIEQEAIQDIEAEYMEEEKQQNQ